MYPLSVCGSARYRGFHLLTEQLVTSIQTLKNSYQTATTNSNISVFSQHCSCTTNLFVKYTYTYQDSTVMHLFSIQVTMNKKLFDFFPFLELWNMKPPNMLSYLFFLSPLFLFKSCKYYLSGVWSCGVFIER